MVAHWTFQKKYKSCCPLHKKQIYREISTTKNSVRGTHASVVRLWRAIRTMFLSFSLQAVSNVRSTSVQPLSSARRLIVRPRSISNSRTRTARVSCRDPRRVARLSFILSLTFPYPHLLRLGDVVIPVAMVSPRPRPPSASGALIPRSSTHWIRSSSTISVGLLQES